MHRKLISSAVLLFCVNIIHDITPSHKLIIPNPAYAFTKADHSFKRRSVTSPPFWEAHKKNNAADTAALKQSSWYTDVIKNIEAGEYEIKRDERTGLYCGANRQQELRSFFNYNSFTLQPRGEKQDWTLCMLLSGIYAGKKLIARPEQNDLPIISSNKIVFSNTDFSTVYINSKEGVRQNFIIQKEPADKPQTINIRLQTNKNWYINKVHDKELHFAKAEGDQLSRKITYNSLKVWDANNKELVARFVVNKKHNAFEIEVNTIGAAYPITVDPISTGTNGVADWIGDDADQAGAKFGINVASAGDVNGDGYSDVIVGAFEYDQGSNINEGRAYVYHGSATGLSTTPNNILDPPGASGNAVCFGTCVNTAGDVNGDGYSDVIISAHGFDDPPYTDEGRAFVYYGSAAGLPALPSSVLDDVDQTFGLLGYVNGVASAGDVNGDGYSDVIIGSSGYDDGANADEGRAFVYYGSVTGLSASPNVILDDANQASAFFGRSVASAGDVNGDGYSDVIVGANGYDDGGNTDEGRCFVYHGSASGLSTIPASILDDADQAFAGFGFSCNSAGDVNGDGYSDVIVGASGYTDGVNSFEGRAFVYYGSAGGLSALPDNIIDDANQANAGLGIRVASAGDVNGDGYGDVIVGVYQYDDGANADEGAAFVYFGSAAGLGATPGAILDDANQAGAGFGSGVASAGDVNGDGYSDVIVGAWLYDDGVNADEGRAFVYHGGPDGLKTTETWTVESDQADARLGFHISGIASAGDVNGDGYSDVILGAAYYDNGETDEGRAFVYYGSATGLPITPNWTAESNQANALFGACVAAAGDVNGDGYSDVIIGAWQYTNGEANEGKAFIYYGSAAGLSLTANWTAENNLAGSSFGFSVASAGDVNADGYSDVIIGAVNTGSAYVYYGSGTGPAATPAWSVVVGSLFGHSVSSAGDVNGDGYSDVIVGAHNYTNGESGEGRAFVYYGSAAGLPATANWTAEGNLASAGFGVKVGSAGDVNGDGYSDVIIGAHTFSPGGKSFVYYGSATGLPATADWSVVSSQASEFFGIVSSAGDVNGDGYSDVIVGAFGYNSGVGRAYLYHGSATGLSATANWTFDPGSAGQFGYSVACAGDVNGDGYSDVLAGSPYYSNGQPNEGKVFLFYGNANGGLRNNLRLYNTDLVTPIQQSNALVPNLFGAGLFSKSPLGRVKGKLVWEVKRQGLPFSGNPITNSTAYLDRQPAYSDLGITGTELKYNVQKAGLQNKVRVRVEYDKATAITGQVYGPWRYPAGYTQGAYGMNSIPLPVKLNEFNAALIAEKVQLYWSTADDENVATYQIERSANNRDFTDIGTVSSLHQNNYRYTFIDNNPLKGRSWYRLRIRDQYSRINFSNSVLIKNINDAVLVYPTIVSRGEAVNLQFRNNVSGNAEMLLANSSGTSVFRKTIVPAGGTNYPLIFSSLPSGVYVLSVWNKGERIVTQKIVIR